MKFLRRLCRDLAIDLGTANTLVYVVDVGIVADEPSMVTVKTDSGNYLAFGHEAKEMRGRTAPKVSVISPLKAGVIHDFKTASALVNHLVGKSRGWGSRPFKGRVLVGVPAKASSVEERAILEAAELAGGGEVYIVDEPFAAAIGAGLPVSEARGSMIMDIGGGTTNLALVSLSGTIYADSVPFAGNRMDESIIEYIRKVHSIVIGEDTAERIKIEIGSAQEQKHNPELTISGRHLVSGLPTAVKISQREVVLALKTTLDEIKKAVYRAFESTPPELMADLVDRGLYVVGGGSLLRDFDLWLAREVEVPVTRVERPLTAVVDGQARILAEWDKYRHLLRSRHI